MAKIGSEQKHLSFPEYFLVMQLKTNGLILTEFHTNESSMKRSSNMHKEYYNLFKYKYNGQDFVKVVDTEA